MLFLYMKKCVQSGAGIDNQIDNFFTEQKKKKIKTTQATRWHYSQENTAIQIPQNKM